MRLRNPGTEPGFLILICSVLVQSPLPSGCCSPFAPPPRRQDLPVALSPSPSETTTLLGSGLFPSSSLSPDEEEPSRSGWPRSDPSRHPTRKKAHRRGRCFVQRVLRLRLLLTLSIRRTFGNMSASLLQHTRALTTILTWLRRAHRGASDPVVRLSRHSYEIGTGRERVHRVVANP